MTDASKYMRQYRLIALDLDGTTMEGGQMPTPRVLAAIAAAQARGVYVVVATGRGYHSASKYGAILGLTTPLVCFQGALVKERTGEQATLLVEPLPREPLTELVELAETRGLELNLYGEECLYLSHTSQPLSFYELWFGMPIRRVPHLDYALRDFDARGLTPLKGLFISEPEKGDRLYRELAERFAGRMTVLRSHPLFVEVISPRASKGNAVAFLARHYGVDQAETIAVGDSGNDVSMVQWAGLGVAMGNATPDVLAVADFIAPPVEQDGVATVIEQFVLGNGHG